MITIIHGEDIAASRNYLNEIRQKNSEAILVNGENPNVTDLTQIMSGGDLFQVERSIIIEHLFARRKAVKEFEALINLLAERTIEHDIYLWENKELDKRSLNIFKYATVKTYKLPQTLFLFLDSLKPKHGPTLVKLFHTVLETTDSEMIFFMLVRQVRLLLALSQKSDVSIDEIKRLAPWQIVKLERQAALFNPAQLVKIHSSLFEMDKGQKTGELAVPLTVALDILLIDI